jgi:DNA ligase-1
MFKVAVLLSLLISCLSSNVHALDIMLAEVYKQNSDINGWLMSEKLDGVRGYWDGKQLLSKTGHPFHPPLSFTRNFPPFALEGELWGGRNTFEKTSSIVRTKQSHNGWLHLKFGIFDVPEGGTGFRKRLQRAKDWFAEHPSKYAFIIEQKIVHNRDTLKTELERVEALGGEGLIVRKADGLYRAGRSPEILKVKSYYDMEAVVLEQIPGKGQNSDRLGSLLVRINNGTEFKIGSGFSDAQRQNPPPVGAIITFKYYGFYQSGCPKFPSFLRVRTDR